MDTFPDVDAIIVPGGFGARGFEDKVGVVRFARERKIPFLGLCLGFQAAVVEFARNKAGIDDATSEEFVTTTNDRPLVIASMPETDKTKLGGTMRLGIHWTSLRRGSLAHGLYMDHNDHCSNTHEFDYVRPRYHYTMYERHRHRYEVNPAYVRRLQNAGLVFSGTDCDDEGSSRGGNLGNRMEVLELPRDAHPFFVACQYHPEYRSSVGAPHPLFVGLVHAGTTHAVTTHAQTQARRKYAGTTPCVATV